MEIYIKIETENEAFAGDSFGDEVSRILSVIADKAEGTTQENFATMLSFRLRDINGNTVGLVNDRPIK